MDTTSGYKTSEFPMAVVPSIIGMLVAFGVIRPEEANAMVEMVTRIIGGILALVLLFTYIRGRIELKKQSMNLTASLELSKAKQLG
jgi:fumarate reductase subunit D